MSVWVVVVVVVVFLKLLHQNMHDLLGVNLNFTWCCDFVWLIDESMQLIDSEGLI